MHGRRASALAALLRQALASSQATALPPSCHFTLPDSLIQLDDFLASTLGLPCTAPPLGKLARVAVAAAPTQHCRFLRTAGPSAGHSSSVPPYPASQLPGDSDLAGSDDDGVDDGDVGPSLSEGSQRLSEAEPEDGLIGLHPRVREVVHYLRRELRLPAARVELIVSSLMHMTFTDKGQVYRRVEPVVPSLEDTVRPVVEYLKAVPGLSLARAVCNSPFILLTPPPLQRLMPRNAAWLTDRLRLEGDNLGRLLSANAYVLRRPRGVTVQPVIDFLMTRFGFSVDEVRSIVLRQPRMLSYRVERLEYGMQTLQQAGLDEAQVKACVWKLPVTVCLSKLRVDDTVRWLLEEGLPAAEVPTTLARCPALLSFSLDANCRPTAAFLRGEVGLSDQSVTKLLRYSPDTVGRSLDTLRRNLASLREAGLSDEQVDSVINAYPGILRLCVTSEPYATKLAFLREVLGADVASCLATNPMYLSYAMARIAPRGLYLQALDRSTAGLTSWLSASEPIFLIKHAHTTAEDWRAFMRQWEGSAEARRWVGGRTAAGS